MQLLEGHSEMDKALACQAGSWVSIPDPIKVFIAPILLGTPATCTLSQCLLSRAPARILSKGDGKKERNRGKIFAAPSVGQNTDMKGCMRESE